MNSDQPSGAGAQPREQPDPHGHGQRSDDRTNPQTPLPGDSAAAPEALAAEDLSHELPQRLADAEARAAENHDKFLRAHAEMDNIRRRAQEEVSRAHKFAIESFAESLLPVKDSLELALKTEAATVEAMREGVRATLRQFSSAFEKNRLIEIDPAGQKFDPNLHQAISVVPGGGATPPNHVVSVLQKGYTINDRVLRPALVTVAQA
ncbi:MAG: nucleotide exchange factor GrpE [Burkholderiaceae bacterium]|nr:nucleotide exchange factor GrpE [Burkholderiaceae bacterium]